MTRLRTYLRTAAVAVTLVGCTFAGPTTSVAQDGQRILILGSSTTACAGDLSSPAKCYVNLVKAAHPADTFTVIGRGGTYVGYGTAAQNWTQTVIPTGHDKVVIQLGINDWYVPVAPSTYRTHLNALIKRVRAANPGAAVAWVRAWMPIPTGNVQARNAMWALHGWTTADAMLFDGGTFLDMGTSPPLRRSTKPGDGGWHYNDRGHAELAATVNRWIDQS